MTRKKQKVAATEWPASFTEADRKLFTKLRTPAQLVVEAGIRRVTDGESRREGIVGRGNMAGLLFPRINPRTGKIISGRVRRDNPEKDEKGKPKNKYMSPHKSTAPSGFFYPPGAQDLLPRPEVAIVLEESEKAVLAGTAWAERMGLAGRVLFIATGGCWGWSQNKKPLPDFEQFRGREVHVIPDANVATNPDVRAALDAEVTALCALDCCVYLHFLPQKDGVNGADDLIALPDGDALMMEVFNKGQKAIIAPHSDDALATSFAEAQKDDLRFVRKWGQWLAWDGQRWKEDAAHDVARRVQDFCHAQATHCGKLSAAERVRSGKTRETVQREAGIKAQLTAVVELWNAYPLLLGTPGGTLNLRTGELRPARREDYITRLTAVAPTQQDLKLWRKFLHEITNGDEELQNYLQRVAGYCLIGGNSEHALFFLYGMGANGKSVFVNTLSRVLGDYAKVAAMDTFIATKQSQNSADLAGLCGARLVTATETDEGSYWSEAKIKAVTGGEPIKVRYLYQDFFQYTPQFKLLISGNHKPRLRDVGESMRRRFHLVPFNVTIPKKKRDLRLAEKLQDEWSGILQWAADGYSAWQREGLRPPKAVLEATKDYLESQDVLGMWLAEATTADKNARTAPAVLYQNYYRWADARNEHVWPQNQFSQKLAERGFSAKKGHAGSRYVPLRLNDQPGATATNVGGGQKFATKVVPMRK